MAYGTIGQALGWNLIGCGHLGAVWGEEMRCESRALSHTAAYKATPVALRWTVALSLAVGLALTLHWSQGSPRVVLRSPLHVSAAADEWAYMPLTAGR